MHLGRRSVGFAKAGNIGTRELVGRSREADRQVARRIDLAGQDPRDRRAAANAWIKGFEDRRYLD